MRLSTRVIGIGITVFLLGSILLLMAFGLWKTESTKVPAKFTSGEFSGQSNPADIRGSYSFADIERNFSIPATV
ncbi:MAG: 4Fe-4S binding protein, partial [Sphaerochaetaceae bacterium]